MGEAIRDYLAARRDEEGVRKAFPQLSAAQIRAALLHYEKYRAEVNADIAGIVAALRRMVQRHRAGLGPFDGLYL